MKHIRPSTGGPISKGDCGVSVIGREIAHGVYDGLDNARACVANNWPETVTGGRHGRYR